ncbi:V-ATPase V1 sector subunit E [Quaeritorhiza haematococci]|nr:V-ATPase V1 sector subunit E [Quaeritorhiza haematococci]
MAGRGLNDAEVTQEMNKMVQFIKQEALEKAREIKVKADEEFNIEKAKLVRQETLAIEAFFQKKMKQTEVQRKIAQSNHINKSRLKVLQARQQILNDLAQEARSRLKGITSDPSKYQPLLQDLILQALFQLMESDVKLHCRKSDLEIVRKAAAEAAAAYDKEVKQKVKITIDEANPLPETSAGGVVLSVMEGRIRTANTLEARLELLMEHMLPDIRILLFGPSTTRKFYN